MTTRIVGGSTFTLAYDHENRLVGVSGAAAASFVYDGDGQRVKGTVNGATTAYIGDHFEWTGSTATMKSFYSAAGVRVAVRVGAGSGETGLSWLFGDHLGSTAITAAPDGVEAGELRFPFSRPTVALE
jgi:hypothetical protein